MYYDKNPCHNNSDIPKEWEHDPNIVTNKGYTVAMTLAHRTRFTEIPSQWEHDADKQTIGGETVAMNYAWSCHIVPKRWIHDKLL